MSSNLVLIACLAAGFIFGFCSKGGNGKIHGRLLIGIIIVMLFIMGAILGFMPDLSSKIINYGYSAVIITVSAVFFSIIATALIVKLFSRSEERGK
ncbi:MAG: hypothetical protein LBH05_00480 [Deferribacteraceae bacterium]|jgi:uncharacterized membrane protein YbjE (DUF340 family)|nr:hypothetical protein [Deferribacteraceae bacterium]